jgi:myo-inositol 2-dehydrogenase / D-chiro-inositol 1-dehydrogenase
MTDTLKVAVIGAGDMGASHVLGWQLAGHEVISVTDVDEDRARRLGERFQIERTCSDYRAALADPEVEVVSVCLPLALHAPVTVAAAEAGKHVLCEKPLAPGPLEARAMEKAVSRAGVQFGIGFQRNLAEGVGLLRRWAEEGVFGRPMVFSSDLLQELRPKDAMHDRNGNQGPFTDAGCHYYLLWQTVFRSKPRSVYAQGRILGSGRAEKFHIDMLAIDTGVVTVEYASGDIGVFTASWGLAAGTQLRGRPDRVVGPDAGAQGEVNTELTLYRGDGEETVEIQGRNLHQVQAERFAEAVRGGRPFPYGMREAKQIMSVTLAIHRSIDSGRPEPVSYEW